MKREVIEQLADQVKNKGESIFGHRSPEARDSIYEVSEAFVREVKERGIKNIILPDSSARPLWVGFAELWRIRYPGEKLPGIFFLNPDGFHPRGEEARELNRMLESLFGGGMPSLGSDEIDPEKLEKFKKIFSGLLKMKDEPTLVLDTCIHTGGTMKVVLNVLSEAGFSKLQTAAVSEDLSADFVADFYLLDHEPEYSCYPAGPEGLVEKGSDVVSKRNESEIAKELSRQTREEIKNVIKERAGRK